MNTHDLVLDKSQTLTSYNCFILIPRYLGTIRFMQTLKNISNLKVLFKFEILVKLKLGSNINFLKKNYFEVKVEKYLF